MIKVGVIGCGYWGPNLIRNFHQNDRSEMVMAVDLNEERLKYIESLYPHIKTTTNYRDIIDNLEIDAVAIATPVNTHKEFAIKAMEQGKHVFIEKPMASSVADAKTMIAHSDKRGLCLMVGHTFEYAAAVWKIKQIIDSGELGKIYYINSQRLNLGLFQQDINVVWDLAPHDISIILYLIGKEPECITTIGSSHINPKVQDVATLNMIFHDNLIAFIQCSWLDPNKVRRMTIVGSEKDVSLLMILNPITRYGSFDRGVKSPPHYNNFAEFHYAYRYGDIVIPKIDDYEPLKIELTHFYR